MINLRILSIKNISYLYIKSKYIAEYVYITVLILLTFVKYNVTVYAEDDR